MHSMSPACILHRDLKPYNVLGVTEYCIIEKANGITLKVADLGIAKLLTEDAQTRV